MQIINVSNHKIFHSRVSIGFLKTMPKTQLKCRQTESGAVGIKQIKDFRKNIAYFFYR